MAFGKINAPNEGNISVILTYFFTAYVGTNFWLSFSEFV
jgi:hypothetical protein